MIQSTAARGVGTADLVVLSVPNHEFLPLVGHSAGVATAVVPWGGLPRVHPALDRDRVALHTGVGGVRVLPCWLGYGQCRRGAVGAVVRAREDGL